NLTWTSVFSRYYRLHVRGRGTCWYVQNCAADHGVSSGDAFAGGVRSVRVAPVHAPAVSAIDLIALVLQSLVEVAWRLTSIARGRGPVVPVDVPFPPGGKGTSTGTTGPRPRAIDVR